MGCPQCQSNEISPSGICLVCGYQVKTDAPATEPATDEKEKNEKEKSSSPGMIEMDYSDGEHKPLQKEELPQWRQELSQRLHAIKQKRELSATAEHPKIMIGIAPGPDQIKAAGPPVVLPEMPVERPPVRRSAPRPLRAVDVSAEKPSKPPSPAPRQKTLQPLAPEPFSVKPASKAADSKEIQKLIDNAISRQSTAAPASAPVAGIPASALKRPLQQEGKLILLSRTLSGLIDLIVVVLCTGGFIIAADYFSGIVLLDSLSLVHYSALFLMTYILYSIFFLAASSQTIGMMITDLRVVGSVEKRPSMSRLLVRCLGYLLSLLVLGIGLLWSLFDRESLCFHDRMSLTRVIRVHEPLSLR